ncbi:MAG: hypothetical protein CMJ67_06430 [Planctomycetaceae bacterium]|nr:hypothetical protein [Planctomycetaceae bacterium]
MTANKIQRLSAYAGAATAATAGGVLGGEATADVVIFDIGVTMHAFAGSEGQSDVSTYALQLAPFGGSMTFNVGSFNQAPGSGGTGPNDVAFKDGQRWDIGINHNSDGDVDLAKGNGAPFKLTTFESGESVYNAAFWGPDAWGLRDVTTTQNDGDVTTPPPFGNVDEGLIYIGFRVSDDLQPYPDTLWNYGWVELEWTAGDGGVSLTLHRWGYETEVDTAAAIPAGGPVVPGPAGLFALAIGAAGIRNRRHRIS